MCSKKQQNPLLPLFKEILFIQNQLLYKSVYFGPIFQQIFGTDTLPFLLMNKNGGILLQSHKILNMDTCYFRLESVEEERINVTLLQAFNEEGEEIQQLRPIIRLEKTKAKAVIELCQISAVQLVDARLLSTQYFIESKW